MADSFSDILSNYKGMSVEELGGSLLQRQEQQRKKAAKTAKKSERVQKGLAVLLATQGIFNNQLRKRQEELQKEKTLDLLNVENDAKKLNAVADIMSVIPENYFPELNAVEKTNTFFSDRKLAEQMKTKLQPFVDAKIKGTSINTTSPEYESILEYGSRQVLLNIFKDNKHEKFYSDLQSLDPAELTREELFNKYLNISPEQLTQQKTKLYNSIENELLKKSSLSGGLQQLLRKISKDDEAKGELGLFSKITSKDIEGANLSEMLDSIEIVGTLLPSIDKAIAASKLSPQRYRNIAQSQEGKLLRENLENISFTSLMSDIKNDKVLDKFNLLSAVGINKFEKMDKYFKTYNEDKVKMITDATALSLRFQNDPQFAIDLYKTVTTDNNKIKQFTNQIRDIDFRNKFAIAMTIKAGSRTGWRANASDYIGTDLYSRDLESQGYDPTLGYNNMTSLVDDPITIDSKGDFKTTKDYSKLFNNQKLEIFDKKVDKIINAPITEKAKQKTIDNLFENIDIPNIQNQEEYFNYRKVKKQTEENKLKLSGLQLQEYRKNEIEIYRLENIIEKGGSEVFGTFIPTSLKNIDILKEKVNSLKEKNLNILQSPKGGSVIKISKLEEEISNFEINKEKFRYELTKPQFDYKQRQINKKKKELQLLKEKITLSS